jgi:hypothetical protein
MVVLDNNGKCYEEQIQHKSATSSMKASIGYFMNRSGPLCTLQIVVDF